jgi:valyl-tRNA synthetase
MMMMGLHVMGEVPFRDVYIHALVRDEKGQKMSKTKGNVIDPLELVDEFGADALRMTLAAMAAQGRDIRMSRQRVEGYRNFGTKLWNAARFCEMNRCALAPGFDPAAVKGVLNRWIVSQAGRAVDETTAALEAYRFNDAAGAVYRFTWNVFCDWYLELIKPVLAGADEAAAAETRATAAWALDRILRLLHPFMPFITEELFQATGPERGWLIAAAWPEGGEALRYAAADAEVDWVIRLVTAIRSARQDLNVPAGARTPVSVVGAGAETRRRLADWGALIERLARLDGLGEADQAPRGAIRIPMGEATACVAVAGLIDVAAEIARLKREIAKAEGEIAAVDKRLANPQFLAKAPPEVVEEQEERRAAAEAVRAKLSEALAALEAGD